MHAYIRMYMWNSCTVSVICMSVLWHLQLKLINLPMHLLQGFKNQLPLQSFANTITITYTCRYMCAYIRTYVCLCVYIHMYVCMFVCLFLHKCTFNICNCIACNAFYLLCMLWMVWFSVLVNGCTALAVLLPQESCTETRTS